jgi:hypothetical protein
LAAHSNSGHGFVAASHSAAVMSLISPQGVPLGVNWRGRSMGNQLPGFFEQLERKQGVLKGRRVGWLRS